MTCGRCRGMMFWEQINRRRGWHRCFNCGNRTDSVILRNREISTFRDAAPPALWDEILQLAKA